MQYIVTQMQGCKNTFWWLPRWSLSVSLELRGRTTSVISILSLENWCLAL